MLALIIVFWNVNCIPSKSLPIHEFVETKSDSFNIPGVEKSLLDSEISFSELLLLEQRSNKKNRFYLQTVPEQRAPFALSYHNWLTEKKTVSLRRIFYQSQTPGAILNLIRAYRNKGLSIDKFLDFVSYSEREQYALKWWSSCLKSKKDKAFIYQSLKSATTNIGTVQLDYLKWKSAESTLPEQKESLAKRRDSYALSFKKEHNLIEKRVEIGNDLPENLLESLSKH